MSTVNKIRPIRHDIGIVARRVWHVVSWFVRSRTAWQAALRYGVPGRQLVRFGRRVGWNLLRDRQTILGLEYFLTPVVSLRLFELQFALEALPDGASICLDVSSPRLFSLFVASDRPKTHISVWNPDPNDFRRTGQILKSLGIANILVEQKAVDALEETSDMYDCIWSLSVIEHISGQYDDRYAVKRMYESLRPGGRLIMTFPVDRKMHDETASTDYYGTQSRIPGGDVFFFQRFYDLAAIEDRILSTMDVRPSMLRWFGEVTPGRYDRYQRRLAREGYSARMEDPWMIARDFRSFESFDAMPGMGVCGIAIDKPESTSEGIPDSWETSE